MKGVKSLGILLVVLAAFATARPSTEEAEGKRLIQTSETETAWMTEHEIFSLIDRNIGFMDITDTTFPKIDPNVPHRRALPTTLRFGSTVRDAIPRVNVDRTEAFMVDMAGFYNRYYTSQWGVESSNWILAQAQESIRNSNYSGQASASQFTHTWAQPSIVARIWGSDPELSTEVLVIGAHMDSVVSGGINGTANNRQPGGDDNASGSAAVMEAFRALLESGFIPKRTIEFQWYAAEEVGLRGSQAIAQSYDSLGVNVISMLNFDVVGFYTAGRPGISFLTDYTHAGLTQLLRVAVEGYLTVPWENSYCGYGCSDHASWNRFGVPAASPSEAVLSPYMHTLRDTLETVSYTQVAEFAKLAVAYSIEIGEPSN